MVKAYKYFQMVINILVNIEMVNHVEKENMNGVKANIMKDNFMKVYVKVKENLLIQMDLYIKVNIMLF
jgi:hypothetical protein